MGEMLESDWDSEALVEDLDENDEGELRPADEFFRRGDHHSEHTS